MHCAAQHLKVSSGSTVHLGIILQYMFQTILLFAVAVYVALDLGCVSC